MSNDLLKDRVEFLYGFSVRVNQQEEGNYPIYGSNGATGYIDSFKIKGPGIIIGRKGSVGKVTYTEENFTPTDTAYYLKIKDDNKDDLKFWYYYLPLLGLEKLNTHSSVPGLSREVAYLIEVFPPSRPTQKSIAKVLSDLDAKIELNNRINRELEAMAKTIYDYWFVQFDFPNEAGKPYKSSGGKMVYSPELKREIPEGWKVKNLSDLLIFEKGVEPGSSEYLDYPINENCIKFFRVGNIEGESNIYIDSTNKKYYNVQERDIVVTFDGSVGKLGFGLNGVLSSGLRKIYDNLKKIDNSLIYFIFRDERIINTIHKYATGSIILHASNSINHLKIPFKENTYLKFQEIVKPIFDRMVGNKKENKQLSALRDWLLPMLMNGQVSVQTTEFQNQ